MLLVDDTPDPRPTPDARATHAGLTRSLTREHGYEPLEVEGALPPDLRGTMLRNGPGLFELFGRPYSHLFEGDGALLGVRFGDERVEAAHRVIVSSGLAEERRAGRPLYGTNARQLSRTWRSVRGRVKNAANTSVMRWQDKTLALFEAGRPTEVALEDLSTLGTTDLDGVVAASFSAHPHRVAAHRTTYNFGQRYDLRPRLDVYALPDVGPAERLVTLPLERPVMLHDFIATERHLVFFVCPVRISLLRGLLSVGDFTDYFRWTPEDGTEVIVVPLDNPDAPVRFRVDPFWVWHFANAFEREDGIVIDWVRYDDFASLDALERPGAPVEQGRLVRSVLDVGRRRLGPATPLADLPCEFPVIDPARAGADNDVVWVGSDAARSGLLRVDAATGQARVWTAPDGHRPSEALLAPGGWLLTVVYAADRDESYVAVLDADHPEDGPVAKAWLGHHVPPTFHGVFLPD